MTEAAPAVLRIGVQAATAAGAAGVILPNDPRLIDLLRNPDIIEDRSDLKLSFG